MADDIDVLDGESDFNGTSIATKSFSFKPFDQDANLTSLSLEQFSKMVYSITLSDDVAGGVVEIRIDSVNDRGEQLLTSALTFTGVSAE